jgi:hypothetical protein
MKKLLSALVLSLCFTQLTSAQSLGSQVGEPAKEKISGKQTYIFAADKSNVLVLHKKKADSYEIHAFDADLKLEATYGLQLPTEGKTKHELIQVMSIEDELVMFTAYYDESDKVKSIFAWKMDANGTYDSEFLLIDEIKGTEGVDPRAVQTWIGKSEDGKYFYYMRTKATSLGEASRFIYKVYDAKRALKVDRTIISPFAAKATEPGMLLVDGISNLYMTAKIQDVNLSKRPVRVELPYYWTIFNYEVEKNNLREYPVNLGEGTFVHEVVINFAKNDEKIHAAGFYGSSQRSGLNGSYITTTDIITHQVLRKTVEPLDKAFTEIHKATMRKFVDTNIPRKIIKGVMDVKPSILVSSNGNVYLIGQIRRTNKEVPKGQNPKTWPDEKSTITHYVQGMMIVNFNARGSVEWQSSLALNQSPVNDEGASVSFIYGMVRDKVAFLYNDHPANMGISDPAKKESMVKPDTKNSAAFFAYVDKYGKVDVDQLWPDKEEAGIILPYSAYQLNRTQVLALSHSNKGTYRVVKLTFY